MRYMLFLGMAARPEARDVRQAPRMVLAGTRIVRPLIAGPEG
jgi:hypothetical protein